VGDAISDRHNASFALPKTLNKGEKHVITILQDHMGLETDWWAAQDWFKIPRGILNYTFPGSPETVVDTWKLTGNLGGEDVSLFLRCSHYQQLTVSSTLIALGDL
jgi:hypothetical protein